MKGLRTANHIIIHPEANAVALDLWMIDRFGGDAVVWEPETLWSEIRRETGMDPSEMVRNKIQAIRTLHCQTTPYTKWEVFEKVVQAIDGVVPRFDIMQPPSIGQMLSSLFQMWTIRTVRLSDQVKRYCAAAFLDNGVLYAPEPLRSINPLLSKHAPRGVQVKVAGRMKTRDVLQDDDLVDVQVAKLRAAQTHLEESRQQLLDQVSVVRRDLVHGRN